MKKKLLCIILCMILTSGIMPSVAYAAGEDASVLSTAVTSDKISTQSAGFELLQSYGGIAMNLILDCYIKEIENSGADVATCAQAMSLLAGKLGIAAEMSDYLNSEVIAAMSDDEKIKWYTGDLADAMRQRITNINEQRLWTTEQIAAFFSEAYDAYIPILEAINSDGHNVVNLEKDITNSREKFLVVELAEIVRPMTTKLTKQYGDTSIEARQLWTKLALLFQKYHIADVSDMPTEGTAKELEVWVIQQIENGIDAQESDCPLRPSNLDEKDFAVVVVQMAAGLNADYSKVDAAIEKANALNQEEYKDFSGVTSAIAAVIRNKDISEQRMVDEYAAGIENVINGLEKKADPLTSGESEFRSPQTGDYNHMILWMVLMFSSACAFIVFGICKKRKR